MQGPPCLMKSGRGIKSKPHECKKKRWRDEQNRKQGQKRPAHLCTSDRLGTDQIHFLLSYQGIISLVEHKIKKAHETNNISLQISGHTYDIKICHNKIFL